MIRTALINTFSKFIRSTDETVIDKFANIYYENYCVPIIMHFEIYKTIEWLKRKDNNFKNIITIKRGELLDVSDDQLRLFLQDQPIPIKLIYHLTVIALSQLMLDQIIKEVDAKDNSTLSHIKKNFIKTSYNYQNSKQVDGFYICPINIEVHFNAGESYGMV